jgi:hypothetical protein
MLKYSKEKMKMSKGSKVRPKTISDKEFIENWLKIFGDPREEKIDMHEEEKCNFEGDVVNNGN